MLLVVLVLTCTPDVFSTVATLPFGALVGPLKVRVLVPV